MDGQKQQPAFGLMISSDISLWTFFVLKRTVFQERSSSKTVGFEEQIQCNDQGQISEHISYQMDQWRLLTL